MRTVAPDADFTWTLAPAVSRGARVLDSLVGESPTSSGSGTTSRATYHLWLRKHETGAFEAEAAECDCQAIGS